MDNDDDDGTLKMNIMCKLYVASDAIFFVFASSVSVLLLLLLLVLSVTIDADTVSMFHVFGVFVNRATVKNLS